MSDTATSDVRSLSAMGLILPPGGIDSVGGDLLLVVAGRFDASASGSLDMPHVVGLPDTNPSPAVLDAVRDIAGRFRRCALVLPGDVPAHRARDMARDIGAKLVPVPLSVHCNPAGRSLRLWVKASTPRVIRDTIKRNEGYVSLRVDAIPNVLDHVAATCRLMAKHRAPLTAILVYLLTRVRPFVSREFADVIVGAGQWLVSVAQITEATGVAKRPAWLCLNKLASAGIITKEPQRGKRGLLVTVHSLSAFIKAGRTPPGWLRPQSDG